MPLQTQKASMYNNEETEFPEVRDLLNGPSDSELAQQIFGPHQSYYDQPQTSFTGAHFEQQQNHYGLDGYYGPVTQGPATEGKS